MNIEALIAAANPLPTAHAPGPGSPQAQRTLRQIREHDSASRSPRHFRSGMQVSRHLPKMAVGLAAAAVAAALVTSQLPPSHPDHAADPGHSHPHSHRPSSLTGVLDSLARTAASQPAAAPPGPGQFQYSESVAEGVWQSRVSSPAVSYNYVVSERSQIWIGSNGAGRRTETQSDPRFPSRQDRAGWIAAGRPALLSAPIDDRYGPHQLSPGPADMNRLPTNPAALARLVFTGKVDGGGPNIAAEDWVRIGDLLRETDASPALRAALFRVALLIPGTRLLGPMADMHGRSGIAIAQFHAVPKLALTGKSLLIFAPKTSALLAEETFVTSTKSGRAVPGLTEWTVYLKSGIVGSVTSTKLLGQPTRNVVGQGSAGV